MNIYLVGGAIRDKLLGLAIKDRDWVVTGASPQLLLNKGFKPAGKDFPVFLHPDTHEEYALARTEKKSGKGYSGFTFHTDPEVTLKQDLMRRDLTINAMAEDNACNLIDPFNGKKDLEDRILRHVSEAFSEDPLRILRIARFAAKFYSLGFRIAPETQILMKKMVSNGEVNYLVPERTWQETYKALMSPSPDVYLTVLIECNALQIIMPYWDKLIKKAPFVLQALKAAAQHKKPCTVRFSCLSYPIESEETSSLKRSYEKLRTPKKVTATGLLLFNHYKKIINVQNSPDALSLATLFENTDILRKPEHFFDALEASNYLYSPHLKQQILDKNRFFFSTCLSTYQKVDTQSIIKQEMTGQKIADALRQFRIQKLKDLLNSLP